MRFGVRIRNGARGLILRLGLGLGFRSRSGSGFMTHDWGRGQVLGPWSSFGTRIGTGFDTEVGVGFRDGVWVGIGDPDPPFQSLTRPRP